jgi:hypothetical protein
MPHGLDTKIRTERAVANIRGRYPAPLTVMASSGTDGGADVVALPRREPRPARDGAKRWGGCVPLDAGGRVSLGKGLAALGWDAATTLVATCSPREVVVRAGRADAPTLVPVPVDEDRRLTLPPTVTGALDVARGEQVVAVAVPATGELHLRAAADVLQQVTGDLDTTSDDKPVAEAVLTAGPAGRSRVKTAWRPAAG